jgi:hypothetical protein
MAANIFTPSPGRQLNFVESKVSRYWSLIQKKTMTNVVTFGKTIIRLSPPDHLRLDEQTGPLDLSVGGAKLNIAAQT